MPIEFNKIRSIIQFMQYLWLQRILLNNSFEFLKFLLQIQQLFYPEEDEASYNQVILWQLSHQQYSKADYSLFCSFIFFPHY